MNATVADLMWVLSGFPEDAEVWVASVHDSNGVAIPDFEPLNLEFKKAQQCSYEPEVHAVFIGEV